MPLRTLIDKSVELSAGEENHLRFTLERGRAVTITCHSNHRFYADFLTREQYVRRRGAAGLGMFDFPLGTDKNGFTRRFKSRVDDDYYLVLRVGAWARPAAISVRVTETLNAPPSRRE